MKKKVTFYSPGTFVAETNSETIKGKNMEEVITNSVLESKNINQRYNAVPYGFRIEGNSNMFYLPHVKVDLLSQIKNRKDPKDRILISNMECNNWNAVVTTTVGWKITQPFQENDCIVDDLGNVILKGFEADIQILRERKLERLLKDD